MTTTVILPERQAGDCLLYFQDSLFDWAVALKTWNKVAHVEVSCGAAVVGSVASRNGRGVNLYPERISGLAYILRPIQPFDFGKALAWFNTPYNSRTHEGIRGQRYDWLGLLCFTLAVHEGSPNRMFCSEFATRFYRAGGLHPFNPEYDADHVAPAQFLQSPAFEQVWPLPK